MLAVQVVSIPKKKLQMKVAPWSPVNATGLVRGAWWNKLLPLSRISAWLELILTYNLIYLPLQAASEASKGGHCEIYFFSSMFQCAGT